MLHFAGPPGLSLCISLPAWNGLCEFHYTLIVLRQGPQNSDRKLRIQPCQLISSSGGFLFYLLSFLSPPITTSRYDAPHCLFTSMVLQHRRPAKKSPPVPADDQLPHPFFHSSHGHFSFAAVLTLQRYHRAQHLSYQHHNTPK